MNKNELLRTVYNATISISDSLKINIIENKHNRIPQYDITRNNTQLKYNLKSEFKFDISLYKIPYSIFWFNLKPRYITNISVYRRIIPTSYSTSSIDTVTYDSYQDDSRELQEKLFNYIINKEEEEKELVKSNKIDTYNKDLSKLVKKSVTRDDTLDQILKEDKK